MQLGKAGQTWDFGSERWLCWWYSSNASYNRYNRWRVNNFTISYLFSLKNYFFSIFILLLMELNIFPGTFIFQTIDPTSIDSSTTERRLNQILHTLKHHPSIEKRLITHIRISHIYASSTQQHPVFKNLVIDDIPSKSHGFQGFDDDLIMRCWLLFPLGMKAAFFFVHYTMRILENGSNVCPLHEII